MTDAPLPINVYRLPQAEFDAIPGSPWVYWLKDSLRTLFIDLPNIGKIAKPGVGQNTGDNNRFLRFWWEVNKQNIGFGCNDADSAIKTRKKWFPYMKGGSYLRWYGNQERVVNWFDDAKEMKEFAVIRNKGGHWSRYLQNLPLSFKEGITWSDLSTTGFAVRYLPPGFIFDVKGSSGFPTTENLFSVMAVMNSSWMNYSLGLLNPTVSFQVGDIARVPFQAPSAERKLYLENSVIFSIHIQKFRATIDERTFEFVTPLNWATGFTDSNRIETCLHKLELQLGDEIFALYRISLADRIVIEAELVGGTLIEDSGEEPIQDESADDTPQSITPEELAVRWISYALGVVLGRFQPGTAGALGSAIYRREDFAIGSLPAPDEAEFNELVGTPDVFAYLDAAGGRHVFSAEVEHALNTMAFEDGITVLEAGHARDLAAQVEKALVLMLGENGAAEVISAACDASDSLSAGLRKFLEKDYFTKWHLRWYRKRPVYWPLQSARRSYGFVMFHEKLTRDTLYAIQRDPYLDTKRSAVALKIGDLQSELALVQGAARKRLERELDDLRKLSAELADFAKELESVTLGGYNHAPEWIDDGVILRLAPLWKLLPLWKSEPKKYWERLEAGDFDWSRMAMNYWPERVKAKCRTNKSYAIAHGHEEWYEGTK